jgi:hypothetical protein
MIARIAIMVLAVVLAVPEYGRGPQSDAETVEPAVRAAATDAAGEIVETFLETLDFGQVLERHLDAGASLPLARIEWFAEIVGVEDGSEVDDASLRRAYVGCMNVVLLRSVYTTALQSPDSGDEAPLPPDVAAVAQATRFLTALTDEEEGPQPGPADLEGFADECDAVSALLRAHLRAIVEDPERRARITGAFAPRRDSDVDVAMGAAEIGVPEGTRVVWVRVGGFAVAFVESGDAVRALALQPYWD